jgi:hypothetical protein
MYVGVYILESVGEYMSGYTVTITVEDEEPRIKHAKNKDEIIRILDMHIALCLGDNVEVVKR